jgi:hypothetical protein
MHILITLVFIVLVIVYFSGDNDQEGFTSGIREFYNPRRRQLRMYREKITRQVNEYINNLKKTFSWA